MIAIKGIHAAKPVEVDLTAFFDEKRSVMVRALPATARAKIQELTSSGIKYATSQKRKDISIEGIEQSITAEATMEIRKIKLSYGVISHDIEDSDGKMLKWDEKLWDALDEADSRILETIIDKINEITFPDKEDESDPT